MKAIATLLYNPDYIAGAIVLGYTLRKFKLQDTQLVILIDAAQFDSSQLSALRKLWDVLEDTQILESQLNSKLVADLKRPELARTYTKIQLWKLSYETVLYLDADTLPIVGTRNVTDLLQLQFPENKIVAAPDSGFPDVFNSGVFMLHPNEEDYANLLQLVLSNDENTSFDGADQGLLNQYFNSEPDWVARHLSAGNAPLTTSTTRDSNWIQIPFLYNTTPNAQYEYFPASSHFGMPDQFGTPSWESSGDGHHSGGDSKTGEIYIKSVTSPYYSSASPYGSVSFEHFSGTGESQIKLIHYIGPVKPWKIQPTGIFERWWREWFEYSHGKSIHEAIYNGPHCSKVPASAALVGKITPSELCNPENYHQFASNYVTSANSWDATKESPPIEVPKSDEFSKDLKATHNSWGVERPGSATNSSSRVSGGASPISRVVEGTHKDQIAERVFDDDYDYVPQHLLMMKNNETEAAQNYQEILEEEYLDEEEDEELEEIEAHSDTLGDSGHVDPGHSKIFPWEYKDHTPTRSWE